MPRGPSPQPHSGRSPLQVGDRLPPLHSRVLPDGGAVAWRAPAQGALVVVFLGSPAGEGAQTYLRELAAEAPEFRIWNGRLLVVLPPGGEGASGVPQSVSLPFPVAVDPEGEARRQCGVAEREYAIIVADRWGQVYHVARGASTDALPGPAEIQSWLRFLATQCPECGVPDEPTREEWGTR